MATGSDSKESACNAGDLDLLPGSGRSPGQGNGYPLQYSCLENSMDRGARQTTVHEFARVGHNLVTKPPPPMLSPRAFQVAPVVKNLSAVQETGVLSLGQEDPLEKGMATHSSILV